MNPKGVFQSKTIIGVLVMLIANAVGQFGIEVDQASVIEMVAQIAEIAGAILAIYGRFKAEQPIKFGAALKKTDNIDPGSGV